ncbi:MAG: hypothetical protein PHV59_09675, partial [Victivallales bacterium]|nr:hypothetical protein [Victivallales bacterium]
MKSKSHIELCPEAVEYQSDALELAASRLPWFGRLGVTLALLFFAGAIVWATLGKIDIIVDTTGRLISSNPNIVMKPYERTVIK